MILRILDRRRGAFALGRRKHTPEGIINKLREAEVELARGLGIPAVCKKLGVTEQTYYRWRKEYGGLQRDQVRRLRELERENTRLKRLVADLSLDNTILREAAQGNF
jgi:putative transposase